MPNYHSGKIVFLDETGFKVSMRRNRGRSKRGRAARVNVPAKKTKNITAISGISARIELFKILNGNGNAENFVAYLNELLWYLRFHHSEIVKAA
eukprot:gene13896-15335_t